MSLLTGYTCKICRQTLTLPPGQIIGEKPEEREARIARLLSEHMGKNHQPQMAHAMLTGNALVGLVICFHYEHNDQQLHEIVRQKAAGVRRFTSQFLGRWRITDEMIESMVEQQMPYESDIRDEAIRLLKSMRDQIDEAPEQPTTAPQARTPAIPK